MREPEADPIPGGESTYARFEAWRVRARDLLTRQVLPREAQWPQSSQAEFFSATPAAEVPAAATPTPIPPTNDVPASASRTLRVPREFVDAARWVIAHRADDTPGLLYRLLWRLIHEEKNLLSIAIDDDVREFQTRHRQVMKDCHKMKAFVRFREAKTDAGESHYIAWHEPDHFIVPLTAPFFARRFNGMRWSILTPEASAHWDGQRLELGAGCAKSMAPREDLAEDLWKTYYASIFNPARVKIGAMKKEMAVRYWKNLPEAELIGKLIREAPLRLEKFASHTPRVGAEGFLPAGQTLPELKAAAKNCRGCGLCEIGTQTVFGEGSPDSRVVFVGEQPGDQEDLAGKPFVGPAGQLLDRALIEAGIDRGQVYVTNAVKHFKFERRGKLRLHMKPNSAEIAACRPWLKAELEQLRPDLLICLGLTAAQSVLGKSVTLKDVDGKLLASTYCDRTVVITHPSALLRIQDAAAKGEAYGKYVARLREIRDLMPAPGS